MRRQETAGQVTVLAEPIAARLGLEVVEVELVGTGRHQVLRVLVDRDGGAGVEDCARLSEALSRELDLYDFLTDAYTLEVASPGLDRPLRRVGDFVRFSGRTVAVTATAPVDGQRRFRGCLLGLVDGRVAIRLDDGREVRLTPGEIAQARLVVEPAELREDLRRSRATTKARHRPVGGSGASADSQRSPTGADPQSGAGRPAGGDWLPAGGESAKRATENPRAGVLPSGGRDWR